MKPEKVIKRIQFYILTNKSNNNWTTNSSKYTKNNLEFFSINKEFLLAPTTSYFNDFNSKQTHAYKIKYNDYDSKGETLDELMRQKRFIFALNLI